MSVTILLATRNGARFLSEQLDSYVQQTFPNWHLLASDDASEDATPTLLEQFRQDYPERVTLVQGPRSGAAANFLSLITRAPDADYTAFSDQDDLWLPGKISRAVEMLRQLPLDRAGLYASRVTICDHVLSPLGLSPTLRRRPSFQNALVQNILHGHTIVLNRQAMDLLRQAAQRTPQVVIHDWWVYQIVSGAAGEIIFDEESHVLYRQHGNNEIGAKLGLAAILGQLRRAGMRRQAQWMAANLTALSQVADLLEPGNRALLGRIVKARAAGRRAFAAACLREKLYRQGRSGRLTPALAALTGRL